MPKNFLRIGCAGWLALLVIPDVAQACRFLPSTASKISRAYERDRNAAVFIGRVTNAEYTRGEIAGGHPWKARVEVERVLKGSFTDGGVEFHRGFGPTACDEGYKLPKIGDQWIVYVTRFEGQKVIQSFPADIAYEADPTIRRP